MGERRVDGPPFLRNQRWPVRAAATAVGGFPLLTVLIYVANKHPTIYADAGTLQASVVRLYSVVLLPSGWVRVGCARLCGVHSL